MFRNQPDYFEYPAENTEVIEKIGTERQILRRQLISAARGLYESGITDFKKNEDKPEVAEFFKRYAEFAALADRVEDPEQKLLAYLDEHMLPFDAGLVSEPDKLKQLDLEISNEYFAKATDSNFGKLEAKVNDYRKEIASRLKK